MNEHERWTVYQRMMMEARMGFAASRPTSFVKITGIETHSPQEIMDELREKDPEAHAKLSEIVVFNEDGQMTRESVAILRAMIEETMSR